MTSVPGDISQVIATHLRDVQDFPVPGVVFSMASKKGLVRATGNFASSAASRPTLRFAVTLAGSRLSAACVTRSWSGRFSLVAR